ncbi:hypothetical protein CBR_g22447 [Chara braunii]|uniref:Methyltransferase FkbM domain-containing protein n=1 Tax=Chara braunii TaxID=69332 RepID=A0A388JV26_CHABU|nr:hypothetical protein CBR_g22447 [Chara braunii]|eukprot:GBG61651.1 hypothetical protein CBR_g22447 [Chara braunii]
MKLARSAVSVPRLTGMKINLIILACILLFGGYYMFAVLFDGGGNPRFLLDNLCGTRTRSQQTDDSPVQNGSKDELGRDMYALLSNEQRNLLRRSQACARQRELCGMNAKEVGQLILAPHDCKAAGRRFFYKNGWRTWEELQPLVTAEKGRQPHVCVVGCFANEVPCLQEPCLLQFFLRPGASDIRVLEQLYEKTEYSFVSEYNLMRILDAGGNIGMASMIFANLFPNATIIAIEPAGTNYEMLKMNVGPYPNVHPINAALWNTVTRVNVGNPGLGNEWGTMVWQSKEGVPALTVDLIQDLFNIDHFDFTKIDIEGAEKEVFTVSEENPMTWLRKIPLVMVEMHDWMKAGSSAPVLQVFGSGEIGVGGEKMQFKQIRDYGMWKAWENSGLVEDIRRKQP